MKMKKTLLQTAWVLLVAVAAAAQETNYPYCQLLDRPGDLAWQAWAGYVAESDVDVPGDNGFGLVDVKAAASVAYYRTRVGDLDLQAGFDGFVILENGGLDLPQQVSGFLMRVVTQPRRESWWEMKAGFLQKERLGRIY